MGLDARVFRRGHSADNDDAFDHIAAEARLGNIATVGYLNECVERVLPPESLLLSKVLYSGTHAGDFLPLELVPALEKELKLLEADTDKFVVRFRRAMTRLARAASREGGPIHF